MTSLADRTAWRSGLAVRMFSIAARALALSHSPVAEATGVTPPEAKPSMKPARRSSPATEPGAPSMMATLSSGSGMAVTR